MITTNVRTLQHDYVALIHRVQAGERFIVTRFGAPAMALVSVGDLDRLTELDAQKDNRADRRTGGPP